MRFFVIDSFGLVVFAFDQCVQKSESAFCWWFGDMFGAGRDKFVNTCVIHCQVTAVWGMMQLNSNFLTLAVQGTVAVMTGLTVDSCCDDWIDRGQLLWWLIWYWIDGTVAVVTWLTGDSCFGDWYNTGLMATVAVVSRLAGDSCFGDWYDTGLMGTVAVVTALILDWRGQLLWWLVWYWVDRGQLLWWLVWYWLDGGQLLWWLVWYWVDSRQLLWRLVRYWVDGGQLLWWLVWYWLDGGQLLWWLIWYWVDGYSCFGD